MKQLDLAWILYYGEANDVLPPNPTGAGQGISAANPAWVAGWMSTGGGNTDNTNTYNLIGSQYQSYGSIGGFIKNAATYHCPGDQSVDSVYGPRVRSCAMNSFVGQPSGPPGNFGQGIPSSGYEYYHKSTDFRKLSPTSAFVFVDERAASIDDGFFWIVYWANYNPNGSTTSLLVGNLPAVYHNKCSSFSFADGHAESHRWISGNFASLTSGTTYNAGQDGFADTLWLYAHATSK